MTPRSDLEARASRELRALVDAAGAQGVPLGKAMMLAAVKLVADYMQKAEPYDPGYMAQMSPKPHGDGVTYISRNHGQTWEPQ